MKSGHAALRALGTPSYLPDELFDTICRTAHDLLGVPITPASIIDADRQWFEARCGRDVEDARADPRFCEPGMAERETERRRAAAGR